MKHAMKRSTCLITLLLVFIVPPGVWANDDVDIHGFVSQGYLQSSDNNFLTETEDGSFQFNDVGLNFQYTAGENVTVGAQLGARDLGDVGNDKVGINWAFGDLRLREWLGIRAGITKNQTGLYNETRDVDSLRTWILLPQSVYDEWLRDGGEGIKGVSVYGNLNLAALGLLKYNVKMADIQMNTDSGTAMYLTSQLQLLSMDAIDSDTFYQASLRWNTPLEGLLLGGDLISIKHNNFTGTGYNPFYNPADPTSQLIVQYDINSKDTLTTVLSWEYTWGNLVLANEWLLMNTKSEVIIGGTTVQPSTRRKSTSYYVSASYRFLDWFEAGAYYSDKEDNEDESGADNELKDICVAARFDISDTMVVKLEVHSMDGFLEVDPGNDGSTDDSWMLYGAKVSYTF